MTRQLLLFCVGCLLLALPPPAGADELPLRKPGLWEMKVVKTGPTPEMAMQHCTDEATDHDMSNTISPLAKQICSKQEIQKTATGYTIDSVCSVSGIAMTSHSDIAGDLNAAYTVTTTAHSDRGVAGIHDTITKIEARWLGACKPGQKPGDIIMPGGGFKLNVKDAEKLKALLPSK
jgi:hypothetical protein